jgi:acetoacetyl-CoA synthetase
MNKEGELLWTPSKQLIARSNVAAYLKWVSGKYGQSIDSYDALWRWSVADIETFWGSSWDYFGVSLHART